MPLFRLHSRQVGGARGRRGFVLSTSGVNIDQHLHPVAYGRSARYSNTRRAIVCVKDRFRAHVNMRPCNVLPSIAVHGCWVPPWFELSHKKRTSPTPNGHDITLHKRVTFSKPPRAPLVDSGDQNIGHKQLLALAVLTH